MGFERKGYFYKAMNNDSYAVLNLESGSYCKSISTGLSQTLSFEQKWTDFLIELDQS